MRREDTARLSGVPFAKVSPVCIARAPNSIFSFLDKSLPQPPKSSMTALLKH
jgi:hypothetical protein